jgi:hypothetical protein
MWAKGEIQMRVVAILVFACLSLGACSIHSTTVQDPAPGVVAPAAQTTTTTKVAPIGFPEE